MKRDERYRAWIRGLLPALFPGRRVSRPRSDTSVDAFEMKETETWDGRGEPDNRWALGEFFFVKVIYLGDDVRVGGCFWATLATYDMNLLTGLTR